MRYGIFSDVHSNIEALDAVIEAYKKENIDTYLCIGDVVGYAANYKECVEKVRALAAITVAGNHDWAAVDLFAVDYFNPNALEAILWTKGKLHSEERHFLESLKLVYQNDDLTLVHGTLDAPQDFEYMTDESVASSTFAILKTNVCFIGHTHRPGAFVKDFFDAIHYRQTSRINISRQNKYIINVGSVGQPRDGNPDAAYCIYDTDKKEAQIKRVSYDVGAARKKIIDAGLPNYLGDRLLTGS